MTPQGVIGKIKTVGNLSTNELQGKKGTEGNLYFKRNLHSNELTSMNFIWILIQINKCKNKYDLNTDYIFNSIEE